MIIIKASSNSSLGIWLYESLSEARWPVQSDSRVLVQSRAASIQTKPQLQSTLFPCSKVTAVWSNFALRSRSLTSHAAPNLHFDRKRCWSKQFWQIVLKVWLTKLVTFIPSKPWLCTACNWDQWSGSYQVPVCLRWSSGSGSRYRYLKRTWKMLRCRLL